MLIHVHFLWNHVDILLAAVILVIIIKTLVVATVVKAFGYNNKTSLLVRLLVLSVWLWHWQFTNLHALCSVGLMFRVIMTGWNVLGSNWGICFCSSEPCFEFTSSGGHTLF